MKKIFNKVNKKIQSLNQVDRFQIILGGVFFLMTLLGLKLGHLTLAQGDYYEDISINNRIKEVAIKAPRGNLYDRNGKVLATTRSSFTISIFKDDFYQNQQNDRNESLFLLSRIMSEEGARFTDNYPVQKNMFTFRDELDFLNMEETPEEYILNLVEKNNLLKELLKEVIEEKTDQGIYRFEVLSAGIEALRSKGILLDVQKEGGRMGFSPTKETEEALASRDYDITSDPYLVVYELLENDEASLRKILSHAASREALMKILERRQLGKKIKLLDLGLVENRKFIEQKARLSKTYQGITMESPAKDDFVQIVDQASLRELLTYAKFDSENKLVVPAKMAIELLKSQGINEYTYKIDESDPSSLLVQISYKNENNSLMSAADKMMDDLRKEDLLDELITDDEIKYLAQKINIDLNINPGISVSDWQYTHLKNFQDFYGGLRFKEEPQAEELLKALVEKYDLEAYGSYDQYHILAIYHAIESFGARRYEGFKLAYHLSEKGVARIEETFNAGTGITVRPEPVRYYPNGTLASHVTGYLGKIATEEEKLEFVQGKNYRPDDLIGKTGMEQSQESALVGKDGFQSVLVDSYGNRTATLGEEKAIPGNDVYLSLDLDLQKEAENAIKKTLNSLQTGEIYKSNWGNKQLSKKSDGSNYSNATSAAAVVLDIKTGEILSMVSAPSFDPNLFSTGISSSDWESLFPKDEKNPLAARPLYNISMQSAIQPGSTFKLVSTLAALENGMNPETAIRCDGYVTVGDAEFGCWIWNSYRGTHGYETAVHALRDSCNYYYYSLVLGQASGTTGPIIPLAIDDILKTSRKLGLGKRVGVEIQTPREVEGTLPDPKIKLSNSKAIFRRFLEGELGKHVNKDLKKDRQTIGRDIDQIVSWMDGLQKLSRQEVIQRLEDLGYLAESPIAKSTLCDRIKYDFLDQARWSTADTLSVVIGQGQNAYTPLQMASMMSVFANDGYRVNPTFLNRIVSSETKTTLYELKAKPDKIELEDSNHLAVIRQGLLEAAQDGADRQVFNKLPFKVGVKSGTAELDGKNPETGESYDNFAWMIGFAPYDDPQIAVATVIFQGGASANNAPMTRDIMAKALGVEAKNIDVDEGSDPSTEPSE